MIAHSDRRSAHHLLGGGCANFVAVLLHVALSDPRATNTTKSTVARSAVTMLKQYAATVLLLDGAAPTHGDSRNDATPNPFTLVADFFRNHV